MVSSAVGYKQAVVDVGKTVLVVEDEARVAEVVARYLRLEGYTVITAADGAEAIRLGIERRPDLVILDLMLPKVDGFEVYRQLRARSPVPTIIVTARGDETDRVVGLEMGADDYVSKPFSPRELVARVKAVLRRAGSDEARASSAIVAIGDITVDPGRRTASVAGSQVELTAKEFDLLSFLAINSGHVFTRSQLLEKVWDYDYDGDPSTVTVHVRRLRTKIESDPNRPRYLKTVWGVGYKLDPQ